MNILMDGICVLSALGLQDLEILLGSIHFSWIYCINCFKDLTYSSMWAKYSKGVFVFLTGIKLQNSLCFIYLLQFSLDIFSSSENGIAFSIENIANILFMPQCFARKIKDSKLLILFLKPLKIHDYQERRLVMNLKQNYSFFGRRSNFHCPPEENGRINLWLLTPFYPTQYFILSWS